MSEAPAKTSESTESKSRLQRKRGFASRLLIGLSSAVCILLFQNCGTDFVPMTDAQLLSLGKFACSSDMSANYAKTYQPFVVATCVSCHGATQSPKFALADSGLAYTEFLKTTEATLLTYASNPNHGGGAGGPENTATVQLAQSRFDSCKGGSGGGGGTATITARTQPLTLAATATIALKTYTSLDTQLELGSTNLGGAKLHFQVRIDTSGAIPAYVIAKPSLQTGTSSVAVKAMTIRINGVTIPAATAFNTIDRVIPPNTNPLAGQVPNGNLSGGSAVFEYAGANPTTDTIQFEFQTLIAQ